MVQSKIWGSCRLELRDCSGSMGLKTIVGSWSDKTGVFRGDGLEKSLRAKIDDEGLNIGRSIRGIADEGYRGEPEYLSTRNQFDSKEIAWFKSRALARHETFNAKLKTFQILDGTFRHSHNQHQAIFEAVCAVTVYKMDVGAGLLDPYP
jgi:hypothetical protein